jgi:16S rRNA (guanine966-N2)-methyltransferase
MRVIAGTYRSRVLKSSKGQALRPTSDRLRETLFNVLGPAVNKSRFLDIFAGTGAVGIEALSRGASEVVFIESHAQAAALIRRNLEGLGIRSGPWVLAVDAVRGLERVAARHKPGDPPFDFVFVDPPYALTKEYERVLHFLASAPFLTDGSVIIAEHSRKRALPNQLGKLERTRILRQGDAALTFYRAAAAIR